MVGGVTEMDRKSRQCVRGMMYDNVMRERLVSHTRQQRMIAYRRNIEQDKMETPNTKEKLSL